jgi:hypothetical protein
MKKVDPNRGVNYTRVRNERKLEEQIAYLRWCRMQNERQIRSALESTKSLRSMDELMQISTDHGGERSEWMSSVIKDELSRPLVITDEEMHKFQEAEAKTKKMLNQFTQVKLGTIAKIRRDLDRQAQYVSTEQAMRNNWDKRVNMAKIEKKTKKTLKDVQNRSGLLNVVQIPPKLFDR